MFSAAASASSWLPSLPSYLGGGSSSSVAPKTKETFEEEEDDDLPPSFPLPDSAQRSSARPSSSNLAPPASSSAGLMPPPSFTITAPPLRSIDDLDDDDTEIPRKTAVSKKSLQEPTKTERVIKSREKVALAPGHSALDWARIKGSGQYEGKSLKGSIESFPLRVTPSELKRHNGRNGVDAWSSFNGKVYNITPYRNFHPGGEKELMRTAGRDGTKLFMATHAWVNIDMMMDSCLVGIMVSD